jgi:hypothetical protein
MQTLKYTNIIDNSEHQAYIRVEDCECFGMFIAKLDNAGIPMLSRGARDPLVGMHQPAVQADNAV